MKCPYCHNNIEDKSRYCKHCGKPLKTKNKDKRYITLLVILVVIVSVAFPMFSFYRYSQMVSNKNDIGDINNYVNKYIVKQTNSLKEFKSYDNSDKYVLEIEKYNQSLKDKYKYNFNTNYTFTIYSNNDVDINIINTVNINEKSSLKIEKSYNLSSTYNNEDITLIKDKCLTFNELKMEDNKEIILSFIKENTYQSLMNKFNVKEELFNENKVTSYGVGSYINNTSLVIYKSNNNYKSVFSVRL